MQLPAELLTCPRCGRTLYRDGLNPGGDCTGECEATGRELAAVRTALAELVEFHDDGSSNPRVWAGIWDRARTALAPEQGGNRGEM